MRAAETIAAARGAGCSLVDVTDESGVPRVELACPSGWAAARFLLELARRDAHDPDVRRIAKRLRALAPTTEGFARAAHAFVAKTIRFVREKGEVFQAPAITLLRGEGDCDCHARLLFALLVAGGARPRLAFLHRGRGPVHVLVQVLIGRAWRWLETTVKGARFGEHPVLAARRLGVIRRDVRGGEMREAFMGSVGVEGGNVYRMRVGVNAPRDEASEGAIAAGLRQLGFVDIKIWFSRDELPADFSPPAREDVASAAFTAWAEALYAEPLCRVIDLPIDVPADARNGVVSLVLDDVHAVAAHPRYAEIAVGVVAAPSGLKIRREPNERAEVLALAPHLARLVVLEQGLPPTPAASKGWTKVRAGATEGYVSSEWLSDAPPATIAELAEPETRGDVVVRHTAHLSPAFFAKLKAIARKRKIDPEHAMLVMLHESGLRPTSIHPTAPASGLFGLMFSGPTARAQAVAFSQRSAEDQLDAYDRFLAPYASLRFTAPEQLYQVNFLPASAIPGQQHYRGTHPGAVLAARDGTGYGGQEAGFYRDNLVLDFDRDGKITVGDLRHVLERVKRAHASLWNEAAARMAAAPEPSGIGDVTLAILPWLALGGFVWYMSQS